MDSYVPACQPKDPAKWRLELALTEFMSLGELLKECWGQPALKIVDGDRVILLAPVKQV